MIPYLGIIDGHVVAGDDDLHADRNGFAAFTVVVEKRLVGIDTVGNRADLRARRRFALVEKGFHRARERIDAVPIGKRLSQVTAENAAGMLRGDVTHQLDGKARVVFDDPVDFLNRLSFGPEFDRAELQSLHENIAGARGDAADVDPVNIDGKEADQHVALRPGIDRSVHHGIVQMLTLNRGVIAQHDVAVVQPFAAIDSEPVAHGHADGVGDEDRHAAGALRDQFAVGAHQPDGKVFVFINVGTESGARDIRIDLISDRHEAVADDFECDGIDRVIVCAFGSFAFMSGLLDLFIV